MPVRRLFDVGISFVVADYGINADPDEPDCTNTLIYGHQMQDGTMFAELVDYEKQEFPDKHRIIDEQRIIEYHRIFEDGSYRTEAYEVIAAFETEVNIGRESEFKYYRFIDLASEKQLNQFLEKIKERNLISKDVDASKGTKFLTLFSCSYHGADKNDDLW